MKTGEKNDLTFDKSNTFDLQTLYDKVMKEPSGLGEGEEPNSCFGLGEECGTRRIIRYGRRSNAKPEIILPETTWASIIGSAKKSSIAGRLSPRYPRSGLIGISYLVWQSLRVGAIPPANISPGNMKSYLES